MLKLPCVPRDGRQIILLLAVASIGYGCAATELLPGVSGADKRLQYDISQMIWLLEAVNNGECENPKIVYTEIVESPTTPGRDKWSEKWTVDRCGERVYYSIGLTPTPEQGGTDFSVNFIEDK